MKKAKKKNIKSKGRGPLARKVIKLMGMNHKKRIINLQEVKESKESSQAYFDSILSLEELSDHDPLTALYFHAQNHLSVLMELFSDMPAFTKFDIKAYQADQKYMPSYPPMSPVTNSHFFCWNAFDLMTQGVNKESYCTVIVDYCKSIGFDAYLLEIFEEFQNSYAGLYVHEKHDGKYVYLRELVTGKQIKSIVATGYKGNTGELWYARVLPALSDGFDYSVIFGTPYILVNHGIQDLEQAWMGYLERKLTLSTNISPEKSYQKFMKSGESHDFWMEYITLAYSNFSSDNIQLKGIPDIPESMPLSHLAAW